MSVKLSASLIPRPYYHMSLAFKRTHVHVHSHIGQLGVCINDTYTNSIDRSSMLRVRETELQDSNPRVTESWRWGNTHTARRLPVSARSVHLLFQAGQCVVPTDVGSCFDVMCIASISSPHAILQICYSVSSLAACNMIHAM